MARLTSEFWVSAYLAHLGQFQIPAFITAKGDATAGAILVKLNTLDGNARAFQRSYDIDGQRIWITLAQGAESEVDATLERQRQHDPDIWIIEVEDKQGRHLLDQAFLAS